MIYQREYYLEMERDVKNCHRERERERERKREREREREIGREREREHRDRVLRGREKRSEKD